MKELKIGIIGFDTSHVPAFTNLLNNAADPYHVPGGKVVAGYPSFSADIESSSSRVEGYKKEMIEKWNVKLVGSVEELLPLVDAVLLESNDGRRHLKEAIPVIKARKPVFIDKPMTAGYQDAKEIFRLARENKCPVLSSSSLRFDVNIVKTKNDLELGSVMGCQSFSPAALEPTNPGMYWYGIHGVEMLYTFMGKGCRKVFCYATPDYHEIVGVWQDGRIGTNRGIRKGSFGYGVTVFGTTKIAQTQFSTIVPLYSQLLKNIVPFFLGGPAPIDPEETQELIAFIEAAAVSEKEKREVTIAEIMR